MGLFFKVFIFGFPCLGLHSFTAKIDRSQAALLHVQHGAHFSTSTRGLKGQFLNPKLCFLVALPPPSLLHLPLRSWQFLGHFAQSRLLNRTRWVELGRVHLRLTFYLAFTKQGFHDYWPAAQKLPGEFLFKNQNKQANIKIWKGWQI